MTEIKELCKPFIQKGYRINVVTDIPYGVTDHSYDKITPDELDLLSQRLMQLTTNESICYLFCADEQIHKLRKMFKDPWKVTRTPYKWLYSRGYLRVNSIFQYTILFIYFINNYIRD